MSVKKLQLIPQTTCVVKFTRSRVQSSVSSQPQNATIGVAYNQFKSFCKSLPIFAGYVVVFGKKTNSEIIIDVISSNNLREDFKNYTQNQSRWNWCVQQIKEEGFQSLSFQLAKEIR